MGDDSSEVISGSKSNIPSGVPSETCPSETLLAGDILGVLMFGLFGWGTKNFGGGDMGVFCNCGGDNGGGIDCCSKTGAETRRVSVTGVSIMGVDIGGGISMIGVDICRFFWWWYENWFRNGRLKWSRTW